jgi:hypothetical protein
MNSNLKQQILVDFVVYLILAVIYFSLLLILIFKLRNLTIKALEIIVCIIPYGILCRNKHFVDWYRQKFNDVY